MSLQPAASTHSSSRQRDDVPIGRPADDDVVTNSLQEIERLLSEEDTTPHDPAFPESPGLNRRSDQRYPFLAEVMAILPEPQNADEPAGIFRMLRGWTTDLSPRSCGFVLSEELQVESLLLLINHPDYSYPRCCFSARIFRHRQRVDGDWEYGAVLRPMFDAECVVPTLLRHADGLAQ